MLKKSLLFLIILFSFQKSYAQIFLKGKLNSLESIENFTVYLMDCKDFKQFMSGSDQNIVDSAKVSIIGDFSFSSLQRNTMYRLTLVPPNEPGGYFIQNGVDDNYAYLLTGNQKNVTLAFSASAKQLFFSYQILTEDQEVQHLSNRILEIRTIKLPVFQVLRDLGLKMKQINPSDTLALLEFQHQGMQQIMEVNKGTNVALFQFMEHEKNQDILALAMAFYGLGNTIKTEELKSLQQILFKFENENKTPLLHSVLDEILREQETISLDFMQKEFYLIDGQPFNFDSVTSSYILLDFWASWCLPCRQSIRTTLKSLTQKYPSDRLKIIGINTDQKKKAALDAIEADENRNIQVYDGVDNFLQHHFKVVQLPTYILINVQEQKTYVVPVLEELEKMLPLLKK